MSIHIKILVAAAVLTAALPALAANIVTVQNVTAEPGDLAVRVDIYAHNEVELLEYFNLLVFDDSRLEYVGLAADRGSLWYGYYPTHVEENRVYVHGWAVDYPDCIDPDLGTPGAALYHLVFDVKADAPDGLASIVFDVEGAFDGHWNECSGYSVNPPPLYHDGGVDVQSSTAVADEHHLTANSYPNPATGGTLIRFELPASGATEVTVYDLAGRRIRTLISGFRGAGPHGVRWDGADAQGRPLPDGVYFYRVSTAAGTAVEKILLVR